MLRTDNGKAFDHIAGFIFVGAADRSTGNQAVHARDHLLGGGGWSGVRDFRARLSSSNHRETKQRNKEGREDNAETRHERIVPE
jgi:hypothetical protein